MNSRRNTNTVKIGNIKIGSGEPIMVQSMLNTSTMDTDASVEQAIKIIKNGGELVRITAQGVKEANNLKNISQKLHDLAYDVPLSADIHFVPKAALISAKYVEKVRINPGNFADLRATFKHYSYSDEEYADELRRQKVKFIEFLDVCKKYNTSVRIGTNHGSLSDRTMSRYGDTPAGMVEATMEYLRICKSENFNNVVISLKSSDCKVMADAVRLLVIAMDERNMHYPLHLGVTEAGEGVEARIKSALGIGMLLNEGIGDTIRVSLTEPPEDEILVARDLVKVCTPNYDKKLFIKLLDKDNPGIKRYVHPEIYTSIKSIVSVKNYILDANSADFIEIKSLDEINNDFATSIKADSSAVLVIAPRLNYHNYLGILIKLSELKIINRSLIKVVCYASSKYKADLEVAAHVGGLFIDRLAYGLYIETPNIADKDFSMLLSQNILQAAGLIRFKTEFISCPGCGRTLYNLQKAVAEVKQNFSHLSKLKIAIMGCVVNGPGEMGDADYGYVGAGNGKVNLYKGKTVALKAIPEDKAVEELKNLIIKSGDWLEE